jgi:hypothetical protein
MVHEILWFSPTDGKVHLATLTTHRTQGIRVRAKCGRSGKTIRFPEILVQAEITCLGCKTALNLEALAQETAA